MLHLSETLYAHLTVGDSGPRPLDLHYASRAAQPIAVTRRWSMPDHQRHATPHVDEEHQAALRACRAVMACTSGSGWARCASRFFWSGSAREGPALGRPFAWTVKTSIHGCDARVLEAASDGLHGGTCRCFLAEPQRVTGCVRGGGGQCRRGGARDRGAATRVIIPSGARHRAILPARQLVEHIGKTASITRGGRRIDVIPLPHPSGASTWPRSEPGRTLTAEALDLLGRHAAWRATFAHGAKTLAGSRDPAHPGYQITRGSSGERL